MIIQKAPMDPKITLKVFEESVIYNSFEVIKEKLVQEGKIEKVFEAIHDLMKNEFECAGKSNSN